MYILALDISQNYGYCSCFYKWNCRMHAHGLYRKRAEFFSFSPSGPINIDFENVEQIPQDTRIFSSLVNIQWCRICVQIFAAHNGCKKKGKKITCWFLSHFYYQDEKIVLGLPRHITWAKQRNQVKITRTLQEVVWYECSNMLCKDDSAWFIKR